MSALELRPFEEQLADVIYANRLDQAENKGIEKGEKIGIEKGEKIRIEKGEKIGIEKGEKKIILKLLEKNTAEEISENYNIPLEKIQKIQND
ncbi:hypothetical protein [Methanobrevibacter sp.]|uniref:hypothetical protein n=1 Tax=Methanobrevibacter sp. TaxID=66852 RepID=UPI00388D1569